MKHTVVNDYILIKANPCISDYDDTHYYDSSHAVNNAYESNGHLVTTKQLLHSQRPKNFDKIEIVPAIVYGPLPFS